MALRVVFESGVLGAANDLLPVDAELDWRRALQNLRMLHGAAAMTIMFGHEPPGRQH